jgi:hypothetical protein
MKYSPELLMEKNDGAIKQTQAKTNYHLLLIGGRYAQQHHKE